MIYVVGRMEIHKKKYGEMDFELGMVSGMVSVFFKDFIVQIEEV